MKRQTRAALSTLATTAARAVGGKVKRATVCEPSPADPRGYYYPAETPLAVHEFDYLPSINDALFAYTSHRRTGASFDEKWQEVGRRAACEIGRRAGVSVESYEIVKFKQDRKTIRKRVAAERLAHVLLAEPVEVVVRVWRPDAANFDVHNPYVKPILDGFTQARLWLDDGARHVPRVVFNYEGIDRSLALSDDEREARARAQALHAARQRRRGKKETPMRMPKKALFRLEFYDRTGSQVPLFR